MLVFLLLMLRSSYVVFFFFKQKTAYEMRISDWSSDVCSSDLAGHLSDRNLACRHSRARDDALDLAQWLQPGYGDLYRRHRSLFRAPTGGGTPASSGSQFARWGPAANGPGDDGAWGSRHRSDERRVGKEVGRTASTRGSPH